MARRSGLATGALTALALAGPAALGIAVTGVQFGPWSPASVQTPQLLTGAWILCWVSLAAAVLLVVLALRDRKLLIQAGVALVAAVLVTGALAKDRAERAEAGPADASTDLADPPALSAGGAPADCHGLSAIERQVALGQATGALQEAGFHFDRASNFVVRGDHESFWLGARYEAVVRIRPGRTDVRVAAVDPEADGGGACRLARRIVDYLN